MIPGVAACGVAVGIGGGIGVASDRDGFFLCAGCNGGGHDMAAGACGPVRGTGGENSKNGMSVIAKGGGGVKGTPPGDMR